MTPLSPKGVCKNARLPTGYGGRGVGGEGSAPQGAPLEAPDGAGPLIRRFAPPSPARGEGGPRPPTFALFADILMPDLLLELFSEEIPARMQRQAAEDLKRLVTNALVDRNLLYEGAQAFVTPRRLALHVVGLPAAQPTSREERKGPRVGAPEAAIQGFLKSAGLARIEDATIEKDPKKGEFYVAVIEKPGRSTREALAEIMPAIVRAFPWPKSMRWGAASVQARSLALGAPACAASSARLERRMTSRKLSNSTSTGSPPAT